MRVLVTGSRDWPDPETVFEALDIVDAARLGGEPATLVHGGATGADRIADGWARAHGWTVEVHPADWATHKKAAGYVRNAQMVQAGADICLAFIKDESRGATMTARLAREAGIHTRVHVS